MKKLIAPLPLCLIATLLALGAAASAQVVRSDQQRDPRTLIGSAVVTGVVMSDEGTPQPLGARR